MRIAIVGEGQTEYYCVPKIAGRLGNIVVGAVWTRTVSSRFDWERFFEIRVVPLVFAMLTHQPDKIVVVVDREDRPECCGQLAEQGLAVIANRCQYALGCCAVSVIVSNKKFECLLFADYNRVDALKILSQPVSNNFPDTTDERDVLGWIRVALRRGSSYNKIRDGSFLAQGLNLQDEQVQRRSKSLKKLVKELTIQHALPAPQKADQVFD